MKVWREAHAERAREIARLSYHRTKAADPVGIAHRERWYNYRLNETEFMALLAEQNDRCAICGRPFTEADPVQVDHDHTTGEVRGLLHGLCNRRLGRWERSSAEAFREAAAAYIAAPPASAMRRATPN